MRQIDETSTRRHRPRCRLAAAVRRRTGVRVRVHGDMGSMALMTRVMVIGPNVSLRLNDLGDGTFALFVKNVTVGYTMAVGDISVSLFGQELPIQLISNQDGPVGGYPTYSLAIATPVVPKPSADVAASLFGVNVPIRLVKLTNGNYALGVSVQS